MSDGNTHALLNRAQCCFNSSESEKEFSEKGCRGLGKGTAPLYWCETCQLVISEKRCSGCGLKARKVRQPG